MAHPVVLGVFETVADATAAARAVHAFGITAAELSVVAKDHEEEGVLARTLDATPGADIEDSRRAGRLGELSGYLLAAVAIGMPGVGSIIAAGPLSAELGEAAGHVAGGLAAVLRDAGVDEAVAMAWEDRLQRGALVLGAHTTAAHVDALRAAFEEHGASATAVAQWD
jgi:hypothetical protein